MKPSEPLQGSDPFPSTRWRLTRSGPVLRIHADIRRMVSGGWWFAGVMLVFGVGFAALADFHPLACLIGLVWPPVIAIMCHSHAGSLKKKGDALIYDEKTDTLDLPWLEIRGLTCAKGRVCFSLETYPVFNEDTVRTELNIFVDGVRHPLLSDQSDNLSMISIELRRTGFAFRYSGDDAKWKKLPT